MFGNSDNNRSEGQGGCRKALSAKEVCSEGTTVGTRTGREAGVRAMSVLENAKSKSHRKTHQVEPDGTGREFMHLTRGGPSSESEREVSRGRSSEEAHGNKGTAKDRRERRTRSTERLMAKGRGDFRNWVGAATTAATCPGARGEAGWNPCNQTRVGAKSGQWRRTEAIDA